jgi:hypothetical protein
MKKVIWYIFLIVVPIKVSGQLNLVPNPGFEIYSSCPLFPPDGSIVYAVPWLQPWTTFNSSDFFHTCDTIDQMVSVPNNFGGYQWPHSGNGYAGILCFYSSSPNPPINSREYLEVELVDTLIAGLVYNVSFYVSLGDTSQYACNNIGVHFSDSIILFDPFASPLLLQVPFHVFTQNIISDGLGWQIISGNYVANGGEKYMVIGNFEPDTSTLVQLSGFGSLPVAYYYFDDFNVSLDTTSSIDELNGGDLIVSPNPSTDVFTISTKYGLLLNGSLLVSNLHGQQVLAAEIRNEKQFTIDLNNFTNGIYLLKMQIGEDVVIRKLVKM